MARAKFKLGTLIETTDAQTESKEYSRVEAIVTTASGYSYKTSTGLEVTEDAITAAFRPQVERKMKSTTNKKNSKKSKGKEAQAELAN